MQECSVASHAAIFLGNPWSIAEDGWVGYRKEKLFVFLNKSHRNSRFAKAEWMNMDSDVNL